MINKRLKDVLFSDHWSDLCMDTLSPFGYVLVSVTRQTHCRSFTPVLFVPLYVHLVYFISFSIYLICLGGLPANAGSTAAGFL